MLSQIRGSYALAGAVTATFIVTHALVAPQISRLVDKHGQGKVMPIAAIICILGIVSWTDRRTEFRSLDGALLPRGRFFALGLAGTAPL